MENTQLKEIAQEINDLFVSEADETAIMDEIQDKENLRPGKLYDINLSYRMAYDIRSKSRTDREKLDAFLADEFNSRRENGESVDIFPKLQTIMRAQATARHSQSGNPPRK